MTGKAGSAGPEGNDETLGAALAVQRSTTTNLKEGLATVTHTTGVAAATAAQLAGDRDTIVSINKNLDGVAAELALSRALIRRFVKRLYTDKIFLALTTLLILGIAAIVVYATVKPGQTTFRVPDEVKPPLPPIKN